MELIDKIRDLSLEEIIDKLVGQEISFEEFTQDWCEEYPALYLNILHNFGSFERLKLLVNKTIKVNKMILEASQKGISLTVKDCLNILNKNNDKFS